MDAAYALMVRTFVGIPGKNLLDAITLTNESFGITEPEAEVAPVQRAISPEAQMKMMLAEVKGSPV